MQVVSDYAFRNTEGLHEEHKVLMRVSKREWLFLLGVMKGQLHRDGI